jgi:sugar-specific transcriptional regulator TrmB
MDIESALSLFGLNNKEIKVYVALLELGQATAQQLSKKTGIIRQTIYDTIDLLKQRGLVSETIISNVSHYSASSPDELLLIEEERKKAVEEIVPQLKNRLKMTEIPKIRAFFGIKGIEKIYNDTLTAKEIHWIESYGLSREIIKDYKLMNYIERRKEKRIPLKLISDVYSKDQKEWFKSNPNDLRETHFNNSIKDWESGIIIYEDKVAIYSIKNTLVGVMIENPQIKNTFLKIFNILWQTQDI